MIMASWVQPDLDCSPLLLELLKAVVLGVLVAALMAVQKCKCTVKWAEREASESLQDLVKSLQAELEAERKRWDLVESLQVELEAEQKKRVRSEIAATRLQNQLRDAFVRERELRSVLAEAWREDLEFQYEGGANTAPEIITKEIPYSATELAKLQDRYSRLPRETETEYVWRVSLTGGDRIKLSEEEAQGYWGPGVFLTVPDTRVPWSLTQRVAYWAGGLDPMERGDLVTIPTPGLDQITESVQKAACLQLMHDRHLIPHQPSPMLLKANPSRMKPLIKGLPDPLKLHAIQIQDRLRAALPIQERLTEMLTPGRNQTQSTPAEFPLTWGGVAQELINYSCNVGISGGEQRVWPVRKPNGKWRLTIDYRRLNAGTGPLTAAVPNIAELVSTVQEQSHNILATIDVKDMFFMVPLQENDRGRFAFTWDGIQYTFTRLPQGYKHSPTLAHHALAQALAEAPPPEEGVRTYQYIDDVLIGGADMTTMEKTHLEGLGLQIPVEKVQLPAPEVKFLGIWWKGGTVCIPPETLTTLEQVRVPKNKKELQHALGLLVFWRKHIPDFSIIARPLYDLTRKRAAWDWTPVHEEALKLLVFEAGVYQALGPIHPTDPFQIEWGFAIHRASIHIWQKGPEGPTRPLGFFSRSFKDAEKRYSTWEKGLFVVTLALQEVGKIIRKQCIILRGPFKVLRPVLAGTPPPMGVAQRETVRKCTTALYYYYTHNASTTIEAAWTKMKEIADQAAELF
ncbi:hypothetical protein QYF61_007491 [Mycteria americana]|uniref:ribonuclease H n=1 Tax=Mycteria americana TaxID=33587 RepID=A0AAN7RVU8_MYCAM|nr:hypothetical protein QYF61_007491 [Mycteria americana]